MDKIKILKEILEARLENITLQQALQGYRNMRPDEALQCRAFEIKRTLKTLSSLDG